jgi:arylsulfatase A-like enzyme
LAEIHLAFTTWDTDKMRYLIGLWVFCVVLTSRAQAAETRLNVIVILADDLGNGDLGCYGHPKFQTPRLDAMAAAGTRLTQFNTPMPFCAPTRAALLTGRYPFRCGMVANPAPDGNNPNTDRLALPDSERTLADIFHDAGYATGMVGKWHLGHRETSMYPTNRGFDEYLGILYSNDMRPVQLVDGEAVVEYPVVQSTLTERYTDRALAFIDRNAEKPFFLYLAHAMPHKPIAASERYYHKSVHGLYGDVIAELDASVGRVLDRLQERKLANRTLVIFTSDNGPWFGGSTGGLRGMKGSNFEGGYRVPMIAWLPGVIRAGAESDVPGVTMDIFATVLSAAGVSQPTDRTIDGVDLMPLLSGSEKVMQPEPRYIFGQAGEHLATVRDEHWKLHVRKPNTRLSLPAGASWIDPRAPDGTTILAPTEQAHPSQYPGLETGDAAVPMMLFDLKSDPGEQYNVAAEHPEVLQRLQRAFDAQRWQSEATVVSIEKIWDQASHNAFTDLIRWRDKWFCTFRESQAHVGGNGTIRVLTSDDGQSWVSSAIITETGIDLRDPKLSVTPEDQLMIVAGGSVYERKNLTGRQPRVAFSADGITWTPPQRILQEGDWLWRVTWHQGIAYGVSYDPSKRTTPAAQTAAATGEVKAGPEDWKLKLYSSVNGKQYDLITYLDVPGHANETTLRFMPDNTLVALVRREGGNKLAWIGQSAPPYSQWTWHVTDYQIGGPNFILTQAGILLAGGRYYPGGAKMMLSMMTATGKYQPFLTLPSGGDCSYPGFVEHDGMIWISYYSSHEGKSAIYLAKINSSL